jgi:hypothetical protein
MIGKIYIIKSKQTDKVYVGSTVETLKERFRKHKSDKTCTSREILKYNDAEIELIECYECENKKQLKNREGQYQRQYDCVNRKIEGRTDREYREDNKEAKADYDKEYRQQNKEAIAEYQKEYYQQNKEALAEKNKEYREKNKQALNEKIECPCGGKYTFTHKSVHFKTKKHLEFLTKQN